MHCDGKGQQGLENRDYAEAGAARRNGEFNEELARAGVLVAAEALKPRTILT